MRMLNALMMRPMFEAYIRNKDSESKVCENLHRRLR